MFGRRRLASPNPSAVEEDEACWRLYPRMDLGRTGNAMGSPVPTRRRNIGRVAAKQAGLDPRDEGEDASTASAREVSDMAKKKNKHHVEASASSSVASREAEAGPPPKLKRKDYEREMRRLQGDLVAMQEWLKASGAKICMVFEGRDTAGKGGTIKRITERVSPRVFRVVAL